MIKSILLTTILGLSMGAAHAEDVKDPAKEQPKQEETAKVKPYLLNSCIVSGEEFEAGKESVVYVHEGQEVKTCCKKCLKKFKANPDKYLKEMEETVAKEKKEKP